MKKESFQDIPTLEDVKRNIKSVKEAVSVEKIDVVIGLEANHTMWHWARMCGLFSKINDEKDFYLTVGFWPLLEDEEIHLTDEQKKEILINFIED